VLRGRSESAWQVRDGDARAALADLSAESAQACVTSPPYFWLRDYEHPAQIGLESTVCAYVAEVVSVMEHVRRALTPSGMAWVNIGETYNTYDAERGKSRSWTGKRGIRRPTRPAGAGLRDKTAKHKDMLGVPWLLALGLREAGWFLRKEVIWVKPDPAPGGSTDRPWSSFEYLFLLAKRDRGSYYDQTVPGGRDDVWTLSSRHGAAHDAAFPLPLALRCVRTTTRPGDVVLDPFCGGGTTGEAAVRSGRSFVGSELVPATAVTARSNIAAAAAQLVLGAVA